MITYQASQLCLDGIERSDCVWWDGEGGMLDFDQHLCGKPMVCVIDYGTCMPRMRTCQGHLDVVLAWRRYEIGESGEVLKLPRI